MGDALLTIRGLRVDYVTEEGTLRAIDGIDLDVGKGEIVGVAGESGSGKTTLAKAIMRILPPPGVITGGSISFDGNDILGMSEEQLRSIRWSRISMVFQAAMDALNPVIPVGEQIIDTLKAHTGKSKEEARQRAGELFDMVGIPRARIDDFAYQLSGGMRQRVGIALSLALEPSLVILDEPTTALDVIVEKEIFDEIRALQKRLGFSVLFITHDLARMLEISDRIAVFYAARIAEVGSASDIRTSPKHPYTHGLLRAFPSMTPEGEAPVSIPGATPSLANPPDGCRFHPRCARASDKCGRVNPEFRDFGAGHGAACHHPE